MGRRYGRSTVSKEAESEPNSVEYGSTLREALAMAYPAHTLVARKDFPGTLAQGRIIHGRPSWIVDYLD